jgi:hypothetical protein
MKSKPFQPGEQVTLTLPTRSSCDAVFMEKDRHGFYFHVPSLDGQFGPDDKGFLLVPHRRIREWIMRQENA